MRERLERCINTALDSLYLKDYDLISSKGKEEVAYHVGERSIAFRFAHYLACLIETDDELKEYRVDCEYNRKGEDIKTIATNGTDKAIYPDIIVHRRGNNDNNLLAVEIKTYWNDDISYDKTKIMELTDESGPYKYKHGICLVIVLDREECEPYWNK